VSGLQPQPIVIEQAGSYHLAGIRFRPGGAFPLFRFSLAELTGRVVELEDIWGREASAVRQQLGAAGDDQARLVCLELWLARRLKPETAPDPRIGFAARMLQRGGTGVGRLAEVTNLSHKHFVHEFERQVGLTPKYFGRVQRLQRTIALVGHRNRVDWPEVALAGGFYDQAHLINEFRGLIGITPTDYLARRTPYPGYLNVA
jgi:AraC-like DNA-binding protein